MTDASAVLGARRGDHIQSLTEELAQKFTVILAAFFISVLSFAAIAEAQAVFSLCRSPLAVKAEWMEKVSDKQYQP